MNTTHIGDTMATLKTLAELTKGNKVHMHIKTMIPESDALKLIQYGFDDVSWINDECPSFDASAKDGSQTLTLFAYIDVHTNNIGYAISDYCDIFNEFESIDDAIENYDELVSQHC